MAANLPYLASPGSIKTALEKIKSAAAPDRVTTDFIQTKLQMKGGTGSVIPGFFKKIGLVQTDGTPSHLYHRFRNHQSAGSAMAEAIKIGYRELFEINEYCYTLDDKALLSLICQVTGAATDSSAAKLTLSSFKNLRAYADFEKPIEIVEVGHPARTEQTQMDSLPADRKVGLNLSYTINLNLPATADQAVFNAIFRSLREHLLDAE